MCWAVQLAIPYSIIIELPLDWVYLGFEKMTCIDALRESLVLSDFNRRDWVSSYQVCIDSWYWHKSKCAKPTKAKSRGLMFNWKYS